MNSFFSTIIFTVLCAAFWAFPGMLAAQTAGDENGKLEILADDSLEWHRNDRLFTAKGGASAQQGDTVIRAETITAHYRSAGGENFDIWRITARGGVRIETPGNVAIGENADYNLDTGMAVMTGGNLRMESEGQIVTAQDRFIYNVPENNLSAQGRALVVRGEDNLQADRVSAVFTEQDGKRTLERIEAQGNVIIRTPTETLYGDEGLYRAATNIAEIEGNVRIERGPNTLEGARGQVNLGTNVSRLYGDPAGDGRVRGVFFPNSE
jgi:lipopolysaccharide export system protein LptA